MSEISFGTLGEQELYSLFADPIERYGMLEEIDRVAFLFSGGKDATLGLLFLNRYLKEYLWYSAEITG